MRRDRQAKEDLQAELNELRKRFDGYKREEEDVDEFIRCIFRPRRALCTEV